MVVRSGIHAAPIPAVVALVVVALAVVALAGPAHAGWQFAERAGTADAPAASDAWIEDDAGNVVLHVERSASGAYTADRYVDVRLIVNDPSGPLASRAETGRSTGEVTYHWAVDGRLPIDGRAPIDGRSDHRQRGFSFALSRAQLDGWLEGERVRIGYATATAPQGVEAVFSLDGAAAAVGRVLSARSSDEAPRDAGRPLIPGVGGVTEPVLIKRSRVPPVYPDEARERRAAGAIVLQVVVRKDGSVDEVEVLSSTAPPGTGLEQAAEDAVRRWRYQPATLEGTPVDVYFTISVEFAID